MTRFHNGQNVIRGGESSPGNLQDNFKKDQERRFISARSAPNMTVKDLAYYKPRFNNGKFSYTTVGAVRDLGKHWDVIDDPKKNTPLHVGIQCPNPTLSDEEAKALNKIFTIEAYPEGPIRNYTRGKK